MTWYQNYHFASINNSLIDLIPDTEYLNDQDNRQKLSRKIRNILLTLPVGILLSLPTGVIANKILNNSDASLVESNFRPIVEEVIETTKGEYSSQGIVSSPAVAPPVTPEVSPISTPEKTKEGDSAKEYGVNPLGDARTLIKNHEQLRLSSYRDPSWEKGKRSIGYGFFLNNPNAKNAIKSLGLDFAKIFSRSQSITEEQADQLFELSYSRAVNDARELFPDLDSLPEVMQTVIIDMSYNLGLPRLSNFTEMRKAIHAREWSNVIKEMINSEWYKQVGIRSRTLVNGVRSLLKPVSIKSIG